MSVDYAEIKDALDRRCPRRARHLCKIYADEQCPDNKENAALLYRHMKEEYGLANLD
jgi:hypothetical protein